MTEIARDVSFSESDVQAWCDQSESANQLYLDETVASDSPFGERIVPAAMILDRVSGLVDQYGETRGKRAVLSNIVASRYRDPIPVGKTVTMMVMESGEDQKFTYLDYAVRVDDELASHGSLSVLLV